MDALRALQLLTDLAYLTLGVAAVGAAMRAHERARVDVAILFGTLAGAVLVQELQLLNLDVPFGTQLATILILILPYALLRLVEDMADVPDWQMWLSLVLFIGIAIVFILAGPTPPPWPGAAHFWRRQLFSACSPQRHRSTNRS